jgi:hypothetical protein
MPLAAGAPPAEFGSVGMRMLEESSFPGDAGCGMEQAYAKGYRELSTEGGTEHA